MFGLRFPASSVLEVKDRLGMFKRFRYWILQLRGSRVEGFEALRADG